MPAARSVPLVAGDTPAMREWAEELVARARAEGVELTGDDGLLTAMIRQVLQTGLEVELADHLGYEPHDPAGRGSGNSRNGSSPRRSRPMSVRSSCGSRGTATARSNRQTVPKHQRRLDGLSGNVISLYAKGMTTGDIQAHLLEIYGTEISRETISKITDADRRGHGRRGSAGRSIRLYPVLLIDAIVIKVRDSQVANRPVYVVIGVNMDGERDVLGLWLGPTGGEGAKQWMTMLTELPQPWCRRRVDRVLRRPEGTARRDPRDLARRDRADLCRAPGAEQSALRVEEALGSDHPRDARDLHRPDRRGRRGPLRRVRRASGATIYPAMISSWENSWAEFVPFLEFPVELRKIVYTTNAIESLNARFRRAVRHRGHFPNEQAALKVLYLVATRRRPNRDEPDRQDQRLEAHPERADHPLRRPDRRTTTNDHHDRLHKKYRTGRMYNTHRGAGGTISATIF